VLRQAWNRLAHKQWLIFYPIALSVISTMAFLAVYSAAGGPIRWSMFFASNFERWQFVRDEFFSGFSFTPALGVAVFALLAGMTLTAAIVVLLWPYSPVAALLTLTGLYGVMAVYLYRRLTGILHDWQNLPATLDQLKKDRACLEKDLA